MDLKHIGLSNQLFDGLHHIGNTNVTGLDPTLETQIVGVSEQIAKGMRDQGYRGVFGIDYIVVGSKFYPIENNARLNGSTFAYGIIDRLEESIGTIPAWKFSKMYNEPMEFNRLKAHLGDWLYDGTRSCGVFLFDCQLIGNLGKWSPLIFASTMTEVAAIERELYERGNLLM